VRSGGYGIRLGALALSVLAVVIAGVVVVPTLASGRTDPAQTSATKPAIYGVVKLERKSVRPGGELRGSIVFHNNTSTTKILFRDCRANNTYGIALYGKAIDSEESNPGAYTLANCTLNEIVAKPGASGTRFEIATHYTRCARHKTATPKSSNRWVPECLGPHHDVEPPLPLGSYRAAFVPERHMPKGVHVAAAKLTITAHKPSMTNASRKRPSIYGVVKLDHKTVKPGARIRGRVVFRNATGKTKVLFRNCGSRPSEMFAMGLLGKTPQHSVYPNWALPGCTHKLAFPIKPGTHAYRFALAASYNQCGQKRHSSGGGPYCVGPQHDQMPPLPQGSYRVEFFASSSGRAVTASKPLRSIGIDPAQLTIKR
jgi:uncharacterized OB-fold protein